MKDSILKRRRRCLRAKLLLAFILLPSSFILAQELLPTRAADVPAYTDADRGAILREQVHRAKGPITLHLEPGVYDLGDTEPLNLPVGVEIVGSKYGETTIRSGKPFTVDARLGYTSASTPNGNCINLNHGAGIENCTLTLDTPRGVEAALVGFDSRFGYSQVPVQGHLKRCKILGQSWACYIWPSGDANVHLALDDSEIYAGRQCLSACGSNAGSQFVTARDCLFFVEPERTSAGGAISQGTYAVVCRGGTTKLIRCRAYVQGDPTTTRGEAAFVACHYATKGRLATVIVEDCRSQVLPVQGVSAADVYAEQAMVKLTRGWGSGAGGTWTVAGQEVFTPAEED